MKYLKKSVYIVMAMSLAVSCKTVQNANNKQKAP